MDARDTTKILLKVVGLIVFSYAIFDIPSYFFGPIDTLAQTPLSDRIAQMVVAQALPIIFGLLLWFYPGTITNRIVSGPQSSHPFGLREFERVALTILGIWLVVFGVIEGASSLLSIHFAYRDHPGVSIPSRVFAGPAAAFIKAAVGLLLVLGAPGLQRFIERIRG